MAQPKVSTSPRLIDERSGSRAVKLAIAEFALGAFTTAGAVSSRIPIKARAAPRNEFHRGARASGARRRGMDENNGTSTTTSPVMNADLDGVVRASPVVWNW